MNLQRRILLLTALAVLAPLVLLGVTVRTGMSGRLADQYRARLATVIDAAEQELAARQSDLGRRLEVLRDEAAADNAFALALAGVRGRRAFFADFGSRARRLAGLDLLVIVTADGELLHPDPQSEREAAGWRGAAAALASIPSGGGLLPPEIAGAPMLAVVDSLRVSDRTVRLVGGRIIDIPFLATLAGGGGVEVSLVYHGGAMSTAPELEDFLADAGRDRLDRPASTLPEGDYLTRSLPFPPPADRFVTRAATAAPLPRPLVPATLILSHSREPWRGMLRSLDLWLLIALIAAALVSLLTAAVLSRRVSRPLQQLAAGAAAVDLDLPDAVFAAGGGGEAEVLAGVLNGMVERLRASALRLREAEQRAVRGDLARQVNHDIRNGFTPIRNVVRHLAEVATENPEDLPRIFAERRGTLESGLAYLEDLADRYARLTPQREHRRCDLAAIACEAAAGMAPAGVALTVAAPDEPMIVIGDATSLRRAVQNLVRNAVESLPDGSGRIEVEIAAAQGEDEPAIALSVRDDGRGMDPATIERVFEDFYTTRPDGSGLGLSVVRRVAADSGGEIACRSEPGRGSTFTLVLPAAPAADKEHRT